MIKVLQWQTQGHQVLQCGWRPHRPRVLTDQSGATQWGGIKASFCVCVKCFFNVCAKLKRNHVSRVDEKGARSTYLAVSAQLFVCVQLNSRFSEAAYTCRLRELYRLLFPTRHVSVGPIIWPGTFLSPNHLRWFSFGNNTVQSASLSNQKMNYLTIISVVSTFSSENCRVSLKSCLQNMPEKNI
jgi:hypothetical protein